MTDGSYGQLREASAALPTDVDEDAVATVDGRRVAKSLPVWLRLSNLVLPRSRWVRIRYRSSFFDDPVRPLVKFETAERRVVIEVMNGPVLGTGEWIGPVPPGIMAISVSPVQRLGPFDFAIDGISPLPKWASFRNAAVSFAHHNLRLGSTATPIEHYHEWHSRHARKIDLQGIDRPRANWQLAPEVLLFMRLGGDAEDLHATIRSLQEQAYGRWLLYASADGANERLIAFYRDAAHRESRLLLTADEEPLQALSARRSDAGCIATLACGDTLPDYALAIVAESFAADARLKALYGDEDAVACDGTLHSPKLKPDWSPIFQAGAAYRGRLTCIRFGLARSKFRTIRDLLVREDQAFDEVFSELHHEEIAHVRRILYRRRLDRSTVPIRLKATTVSPRPSAGEGDRFAWPDVAVVVPTRDMAGLLSECTKGLKEQTDYPRYHVVIVDNGSTEPDALAILRDLRRTPRFMVLERPGAFNFSALCNAAAELTTSSVLVFLNNDISMIHAGWLKPLVRCAIQPEIGAVGAKLLFPSGAIQHAGVVIGLGGIGGHLYREEPPDLPGYLAELTSPREVTAVTAACLAVAREKFEAVGGFDAEHLAVELNDVDLCLRLAERGWSNIWTPESVLRHREFGSRRIGLRPSRTYQPERLYFQKRWQHVIRDDKYFHPGLSLFSYRPALA